MGPDQLAGVRGSSVMGEKEPVVLVVLIELVPFYF